MGQFTCVDCKAPSLSAGVCSHCKGDRRKYTGLIFHDLRRTAARNLRRAGISETVIMKIGGWGTRSVLERYAIVSRGDMVDAMQKLQRAEQESQASHVISHVESATRHHSRHSRELVNRMSMLNGAGRGGRTPTTLRSADFESAASASSAIPAQYDCSSVRAVNCLFADLIRAAKSPESQSAHTHDPSTMRAID